jgi:predicted MFS family arabinose efflux permease
MHHPRGARAAALAIAVVFFVNGAAFASWIPRIPEIQATLSMDNATLGLVLAGAGLGGLVGTVLSPTLLRRIGSRPAAIVAGSGVALALPVVAIAPRPATLALVLLVAALFDAVTDIAMNDLGVRVQRETGRSIMNRLHGGWSLGTLAGALTSSVVAGAGVSVGSHFAAVALVLTVTLAATWRFLPTGRPVPAPPTDRRGALGAASVLLPLAFAAAIVEGTPAEWSGVFLADVFELGPGAVGLGFTLFATGMLAGRLAVPVHEGVAGQATTNRAAAVLVVGGVATVVVSPVPVLAVAGFGLLGLGASVLFPLIYGAAGSLAVISSGAGLAVMSIGARAGFLTGPPLMGLISDALGLRAALGLLVAGALVALTVARSRLDAYAA